MGMSFKNFYNKSLFLENVRGEYWIDSSGEPWYADGDISDVNHANYIMGLMVGSILDELNVQVNDEQFAPLDYYSDKIFAEIQDDLTPEMIEKWEEGSRQDQYNIILHLIGDTPQNRDKLSTAYGHGDPRVYGLKYMGYKRVKGNNIQTFTLTQRDFEVMKRGMNTILEQESIEDADLKDMYINIEVMSNGHFFREVPYLEFIEGQLQSLLHYKA